MSDLLNWDAMSGLLTLTAMEVVLGIDNVVFIAILVARLPAAQQAKARAFGLGLALLARVALLFSISWIMSLKEPLFAIFEHGFSGRDLILLAGGMFLIGKATFEIHHKVEADELATPAEAARAATRSFAATLVQIALLDIVFSLDSVITAVGMVSDIRLMVIAVVISMAIMLAAAPWISSFIERHPTIKILALSFLILIGVMLAYEGMGGHMPKAYVYFAMLFSLSVELLNMRYRSRKKSSA